jgi:uncharacterized protein YlxW (UPF0749 family)
MQLKGYPTAVGAVAMLLGFLLVIQLKTQQTIRVSLPTHQASDLALMLREQQKALSALESELTLAKKEQESITIKTELRRLKSLLGLTDVNGPGLKIVLSDTTPTTLKGDPLEGKVTYDQVDIVINELWAAGSEAVSINGERITTTTGIGTTNGYDVVVNGVKVKSPYEILAIGDPATLDNALRMRNSAVDILRFYDIGIKLTQATSIHVPKHRKQLHYSYMMPLGQQMERL